MWLKESRRIELLFVFNLKSRLKRWEIPFFRCQTATPHFILPSIEYLANTGKRRCRTSEIREELKETRVYLSCALVRAVGLRNAASVDVTTRGVQAELSSHIQRKKRPTQVSIT